MLGKAAASLLILGFIYCNLAVMFHRSAVRGGLNLPLPRAFSNVFALFGVFSSFELVNREVVIRGLRADAAPGEEWIRISPQEFFPVKRGEQLTRAWVGHQLYFLGQQEQQRGMAHLSRKIRERYNAANPENPLQKVAIQVDVWPRSLKGYKKLKTPDQTTTHTWYYDP
jgi:hypothetical protein